MDLYEVGGEKTELEATGRQTIAQLWGRLHGPQRHYCLRSPRLQTRMHTFLLSESPNRLPVVCAQRVQVPEHQHGACIPDGDLDLGYSGTRL